MTTREPWSLAAMSVTAGWRTPFGRSSGVNPCDHALSSWCSRRAVHLEHAHSSGTATQCRIVAVKEPVVSAPYEIV